MLTNSFCRDWGSAASSLKEYFRSFRVPAVCCIKAQGRRLCGTTWVTSNIDVTQNVYGNSWWEERVDTFPARCTRQPSCGRLSKRGPPAQTSTVGQFPVSDRLNPDELSRPY